MILPGEPGSEYLVKYRHRTLGGIAGLFGSIGVTLGGIAILTSSHHSFLQATGDVTIAAGSCGYSISIFALSGIKQHYVNKAVKTHNEALGTGQ